MAKFQEKVAQSDILEKDNEIIPAVCVIGNWKKPGNGGLLKLTTSSKGGAESHPFGARHVRRRVAYSDLVY